MAIHFRQAADPDRARDRVLAVLAPIAESEQMAVSEGRMVVELRPPPPLGKGRAVRDLALSRGLTGLIYLGDDQTDIEAFEAVIAWRDQAAHHHGVNVAVWSAEMPPALAPLVDFVLSGVPDVALLLQALARIP